MLKMRGTIFWLATRPNIMRKKAAARTRPRLLAGPGRKAFGRKRWLT